MKRFPYVLLLVGILLTSCQFGAASPTDTPVPPPSNTPEPTSTPLPTDTATPAPTATPDTAATAAAQATAGASSVLDELEKVVGSDTSFQDGHLVWQQTEAIAINMSGPSADDSVHEIDGDITAGNFVFKSDVTWKATGWMYCGAIFRSESNLDNGEQYQFYFLRFSGLPAWYIDVYDGGRYQGSVTKEQFSGEIDIANEAVNQFVVVAEDNQFTVYFNGVDQGRYFDNSKQRSEGSFGFMAWQESGTGSCKFSNSWIWSLDQ